MFVMTFESEKFGQVAAIRTAMEGLPAIYVLWEPRPNAVAEVVLQWEAHPQGLADRNTMFGALNLPSVEAIIEQHGVGKSTGGVS